MILSTFSLYLVPLSLNGLNDTCSSNDVRWSSGVAIGQSNQLALMDVEINS